MARADIEGVMFYTSYHQDGYEDARDEIAAAIREGVEDEQGTAGR